MKKTLFWIPMFFVYFIYLMGLNWSFVDPLFDLVPGLLILQAPILLGCLIQYIWKRHQGIEINGLDRPQFWIPSFLAYLTFIPFYWGPDFFYRDLIEGILMAFILVITPSMIIQGLIILVWSMPWVKKWYQQKKDFDTWLDRLNSGKPNE